MKHVTMNENSNCKVVTNSQKAEVYDRILPDKKFHIQIMGKSDIKMALSLWRELESELNSSRLMCSADWTSIWLNCYSDLIDPHFVIGYHDGKMYGICLISESKQQHIGPVSVNTLHLGTAGEPHGQSVCVEYNEILCAPKYRNRFLRELQKCILARENWDRLQLDGISSQSAPLNSELPGLRKTVCVRESRFFDLEHCRMQGGDILSLLGKSTRSNIRRRMKKLGELKIEWADSLEQGTEIFAELIELHQARWHKAGEPGAFASQRFAAFQMQLIEKLLPLQKVVLCRITADSRTVGCLYLLVDGLRLLDYISGLASFDEIPGSGLISHYLCMNEALDRGYQAYDFLVGDKRHKENLGKSSNELQWISHERNRVIFQLRDFALQGKSLLKRIIKKS